MSDFRSLLSSFKAAVSSSAPIKSHYEKSKSSLEECIKNLWQKTQIKKSIACSTAPNTPMANDQDHDSKIHVAICAVIVSTLPHEDIWKSWLNHRSGNTSGTLYIHAKTPSAIRNNSWLKSKLIPISHNPNWNDIKIVQAML